MSEVGSQRVESSRKEGRKNAPSIGKKKVTRRDGKKTKESTGLRPELMTSTDLTGVMEGRLTATCGGKKTTKPFEVLPKHDDGGGITQTERSKEQFQ